MFWNIKSKNLSRTNSLAYFATSVTKKALKHWHQGTCLPILGGFYSGIKILKFVFIGHWTNKLECVFLWAKQERLVPNQTVSLSIFQSASRIIDLPENIGLGLKGSPRTNTLAYLPRENCFICYGNLKKFKIWRK